MFKLFSKKTLSIALALVSFGATNSALQADYCMADDCCFAQSECCYDASPCRSSCGCGLYIGAFGGGIFSNKTHFRQEGIAFFDESLGGPLDVNATGRACTTSSGFGGVQIGYEWSHCPLCFGCGNWSIVPALELEGYWYSHTKKATLENQLSQERLPEHTFANKFPMDMGVYLVNGVFTFNSCGCGSFSPYIGGGIGAANASIHRATSLQINPVEVGVNHFNSKRHNSAWAFAAQAKVGVGFNFCQRWRVFGEYRFLYTDTNRFTFGSTVYPSHVPTTSWKVRMKNNYNNAFAIGVQYRL